jgi:Domain of unknown function (DUF3576)
MRHNALKIFMLIAVALPISACAHKSDNNAGTITAADGNVKRADRLTRTKIKAGEPSIGVNGYLWRATLDTLNFMPVVSADPFGGTFVTDWHSSAQKPSERLKVQVFILDTRLRADGIAVQVFRQTKNGADWVDASVDPDTSLQIENAILTRARQLRIATLESKK